MSAKTVRSVREPLKKPRPLKSVPSEPKFNIPDPKDTVVQKSREEILADLETLNVSISNWTFDEVTAMDISRMCSILKKRGEELDSFHKEAIDRYFCTLRNACRDERLDIVSRVKLLEVIELRAKNWKKNENLLNYFNMKITELEQKNTNPLNITGMTAPTIPYSVQNQNLNSPTGVQLGPGEILRSSGKFEKPTKIAGKNYFKDEIVIRNSDSGKVMGIKGRRVHMIEELSDTVISFQRVSPGARDRLVQITGPHEEAIGHAKLLVEDTIRRNASPVRDTGDLTGYENNRDIDFGNSFSGVDNQAYLKKNLQHSYSMSDASLREFSVSLQIGQETLTLTGTNADLLKTARSVLKEYFAGQSEILEKHESLSRQLSSENNSQRFDLRKQSSFKNSMNSFSSWKNNNFQRESISPSTSSDDDMGREERVKNALDLSPHDFLDNSGEMKKQNSVSSESSAEYGKFIRSSSLPNENTSLALETLSNVESVQNEDVFSPVMSPDSEPPPIPPPSYKRQTYSREFLLKCAKSPFSHNQPAEYARIHQNYREIICQSPVMFDPDKYEESRLQESAVLK
ncbi:eukaryotic translation initiation factor 4E-binding protein Mextli homolog isoform X2 [Argiope bruennichi]|uniref:eukaryotic translation initiation factor 4E-binding protein Mextli homolog isoform X2 n=1 Tax=Argiope bruennichi TaxID=94029 RepID=UPI0024943785|nr:eukaryotic translation initiation factor 4E-binding protein Mextli homolog isoform X2 [Argiope bruennichi]